MSDDLIRRQEMGEAIDRIRLDLKHETFYSFYQKALMALNEVPTVDAVTVVRCRDCKHYNAGFECLIEGYGIERDREWYCGDGERREE